jgi:hypothetical protein
MVSDHSADPLREVKRGFDEQMAQCLAVMRAAMGDPRTKATRLVVRAGELPARPPPAAAGAPPGPAAPRQ